MTEEYGPIKAQRKSGIEPITREGVPTEMKVIDFWQWAHSDLAGNALRGVYAEYLVASALRVADNLREEWAAYDVLSPEKIRIEVKSAAYMQSWSQRKPSTIRFSVGRRR